jgi:hypothetical protein
LGLAAGSRCAQKFDETGETDAQAHAAGYELKCFDEADVRKFLALMQVEEAEGGEDDWQDDTRHEMASLHGH